MRKLITSLCCLLTLSMVMVGCYDSKKDTEKDNKPAGSAKKETGSHAHGEGPHGGTIADWGGGKFHVEFTVNHDKEEATVYVLGSDEKTASPIDAKEIQLDIEDPKLQTKLIAKPLEGDPEGKSSRFVGTHKGLGVVKEYKGTISGAVEGTPYSGNFEEVAH